MVNRGTHGLRTTVRWVLSPDRRSILVVEDAVSIEADPLPDGFLYASEVTGAVVQVDSVWDVAPSPDWTRLAYGRAYVLRGGEQDSIPAREWERVEAQLPADVGEPSRERLDAELRARAFPVSGMTLMLGLGVTHVLWVDRPRDAHHPGGPTHSLHGWRVRWTRGGDTLGVGAAPRAVQDDAPPARWVLVRPRMSAVHRDTLGGTTDSSRFVRVRWVEGPTMELGGLVENLPPPLPVTIDGGTIEARGGTIWIMKRDRGGRLVERVVGAGVPLAATATGQFVAALVRRDAATPQDMPFRTVVYHVSPK